MPVTPAAVSAFLAPLQALRPITSRKMFGGIGIYCEGVFFAVIDNDRLYFNTDPLTDPAYDQYDAETWIIEGSEPSRMPYREVPEPIFKDADVLGTWIDEAVEVANRKKSRSSSRPKNT